MNPNVFTALFIATVLTLGTLAAIGPPARGDEATTYRTATASEPRPLR